MTAANSLQRFVERALAFAHTALEQPTEDNLSLARLCADDALGRMRTFEFTLGEARQIVLLVSQLRAVLATVDRRTVPRSVVASGGRGW
jgi:hypothetical protein